MSGCEKASDRSWQLQLRAKEAQAARDLRARFVIDASGQNTVLARATGAEVQMYDQLVGIVGFFDLDEDAAERTHNTLIETCQDGWWYWALLPGGSMVATFMTDAEIMREQALTQPDEWLAKLEGTQHLAVAHGRPSPLSATPSHQGLTPPVPLTIR